jgi:hypothetical protein
MRHGTPAALALFAVLLPAGGLSGRALAQDTGSPTVAFTTAGSSGGEGPFDMSVVLSTPNGQPTTAPVTVNFNTVDGTALAGSDFAAAVGTLTFPAGTTSGAVLPINVNVIADGVSEAAETFSVGLSGAVGASIVEPASEVRTIVDTDAQPTVSVADVAVPEGDGGAQNAIFTVTLSGASGQDVVVSYATADGTASGISDFFAIPSGTLTIPAGTTTAPLPVLVLGDTAPEDDETFTVTLTGATHSTIGRATATGTIRDDDTPGSFEFSTDSFRASEAGRVATITVNRVGGNSEGATVSFDVTEGTARSGVNFAPTSGTLTFGRDETSQTFTVPLMADTVNNQPRTALLRLSLPSTGATIGTRATAPLTILDNDPAGIVQFGRVAFRATEAGGQAAITVRRIRGTAGDVTVHLGSENGTATTGQDLANLAQDITFGPGEVVRTITVPITQDTLAEGNEALNLMLSNPGGGATLGTPSTATLNLIDAQQSVFFDQSVFNVGEGVPRATIVVRRTGDLSQPATVQFATNPGGTATAGSDFTTTSGTLTFAPFVAVRTFPVLLTNDLTIGEGAETVDLALSNATGAAIPATGRNAVLSIGDNDPTQTLQFTNPAFVVNERSPRALITVRRTGGRIGTMTVNFSAVNDTATDPGDFEATSGTLTFRPGVVAQTFAVPIVNDTLDEGTENLTLRLSSPSAGSVLGTNATATLRITDNEPTVQFTAAKFASGEAATRAFVTVRRTGPATETATVRFATSNGTAGAGQDFVGTSGVLTFAPGVVVRRLPITLMPDQRSEGNESFNVTLSDASGAALGTPATAAVSLVDNDLAGQAQFAATTLSTLESAGPVTITVLRSGGAADGASVHFEAIPGTASPAVSPRDFTGTSGTLTFGPGETSKTFTVNVADDTVADGNHSVLLRLSDPTGGLALGPKSEATLWLVDDE